jgi:Domain of unknown function (DUF1707)/Domain of unknown function (DUF4190)
MATRSYYGQMRATDSDRENVHQVLQAAYGDGRLSWDEFDARSSKVVVAKTYDQLSGLTADLRRPVPYRPPAFVPARSGTNGLAGVSLAFGVGQVFLPIVGAVIAIVCGHVARSEIRKNGQQGDGLALTGLVLGYLGVALPALITFIALVAAGH